MDISNSSSAAAQPKSRVFDECERWYGPVVRLLARDRLVREALSLSWGMADPSALKLVRASRLIRELGERLDNEEVEDELGSLRRELIQLLNRELSARLAEVERPKARTHRPRV